MVGKGDIFGTDVPYISKVQAIKEAKYQWFRLTDKEKKERTITACLMDLEAMESYDEINADTIE